jgi:protein-S-isoprenylcysteine O-methyltransferase Ste14
MVEARKENKLTFRQLAQRIRVPAGFVLAPLLFIAARPTVTTLVAGAAVAIVGLSIRAWASGCLMKNMKLATTGPYAHTRNPLYLGTFLLGTGIALSGGALWFAALFVGFYLLIYVPVMMAEAETMKALFPGDYEHYSERVPLFIPRLSPYRKLEADYSQTEKFDLSRYRRHREYRAAFGTIAVYALLVARMIFIK